jgi:hypothetical protein
VGVVAAGLLVVGGAKDLLEDLAVLDAQRAQFVHHTVPGDGCLSLDPAKGVDLRRGGSLVAGRAAPA